MDITTLRYFKELSKHLHFTETADKLYMSQQTLSNHIHRLETELGAKLFYRKPKLSLTYSGEIVLKFAETVVGDYDNLIRHLNDVNENYIGEIKFGASYLRTESSLPKILPKFSKKYPNITIDITDANTEQLETLILNNHLDVAIITPRDPQPSHIVEIEMMLDQIYLCASESLLRQHFAERFDEAINQSLLGANLNHFAELPFCLLNNHIGKLVDRCFEAANVSPKVYAKSTKIQLIAEIGIKSNVAFFATRTSLLNLKTSSTEQIYVFPLYLDNQPVAQKISLIYNSERYSTEYLSYFIELLVGQFRSISALPYRKLITITDWP